MTKKRYIKIYSNKADSESLDITIAQKNRKYGIILNSKVKETVILDFCYDAIWQATHTFSSLFYVVKKCKIGLIEIDPCAENTRVIRHLDCEYDYIEPIEHLLKYSMFFSVKKSMTYIYFIDTKTLSTAKRNVSVINNHYLTYCELNGRKKLFDPASQSSIYCSDQEWCFEFSCRYKKCDVFRCLPLVTEKGLPHWMGRLIFYDTEQNKVAVTDVYDTIRIRGTDGKRGIFKMTSVRFQKYGKWLTLDFDGLIWNDCEKMDIL